jgi:hypothetical protein
MSSATQKHCGLCSQCIDRRVAILAHKSIDTSFDYETDVFLGERKFDPTKNIYDKGIAVSYIRFANEISKMTEEQFEEAYGSLIYDAADALEGYKSIAPLIDMHKRHASTVVDIIEDQIVANKSIIASGELHANSLLSFVINGIHKKDSATLFAENIYNILSTGIPKSCKNVKPTNEAHLQDICSGILSIAKEDIQREFPFVSWSFSLSKPDFSNENVGLFIELKYIKKGQAPSKITEQIAADITKYNIAKRHVLFIIYDPDRVVSNDDAFMEDIHDYPKAHIRIIR